MNLTPSPRLRRLHTRLLGQIDELVALTGDPAVLERRAESVSGWSVGEHIEHLLRVDTTILDRWDQIEQGRAPSASGGPKLRGLIVLWLGRIPRGKAKAAPMFTPEGIIAPDELSRALKGLRGRIDLIGADLAVHATASWRADHPILGPFSPTQWLRFIEIHHRHHLAILADILQVS